MIINKLLLNTYSMILLSFGFALAQEQPKFSFKNGIFHGEYQSFHENGQLKSKGNFNYNRRIGDWKVYNDEGELLAHRYFDSLGHVKVIAPKTGNDAAIELLDQPRYKIERNENGVYEFLHIYEGNMVWTKRVLSYLTKKSNPEVYEFDWMELLNKFYVKEDLSTGRSVFVYKNDQFSSLYEENEVIETTNLIVLGIGIKKDYYYDLASRKLDARVLGVTLFAEDTITKQTKEFTLFYPTDLRPLLVNNKINHEDSTINNLDDLFYFNAYGEIIYSEESLNNQYVQFNPKKATDFLEFSKQIKMQIIAIAHEYWVRV